MAITFLFVGVGSALGRFTDLSNFKCPSVWENDAKKTFFCARIPQICQHVFVKTILANSDSTKTNTFLYSWFSIFIQKSRLI